MPRKAAIDLRLMEDEMTLNTISDATIDSEREGLFLVGKVADRVRKTVVAQGKEVEVVTYTILCGGVHRFYVDDFNPERHFSVGENISIPVYVKAYRKKSGEPSYMLKLQKSDVFIASRGERF